MKAHARRRFLLALALSLAMAGLHPSPALAALHPDAAEADARSILQSNDYKFCTDPDDPLSWRARSLCPLAGEVPGCGALVDACDKRPPEEWHPGPFWRSLLGLIAKAGPYLAWGALVALAAAILYLVVRAARDASDEVLPGDARLAPDVSVLPDGSAAERITAAEVLLGLARDAAARGDERSALQTYLAAALRALDDRGAIRVSRDRTNGEYVRSCKEAASRPTLRELVREVDLVQFGGHHATADAVTRVAGRAEQIVRSLRTKPAPGGALTTMALMALGVVLSLGACKGIGASGRADPAGRDLLTDLLTKQGATVTSPPGSLVSLPMKGPTGPVVVLDAELVVFEQDTRDHLVAWVKQGGTLVLAGDPSRWPAEFWVKPLRDGEADDKGATAVVHVETWDAVSPASGDDDDDERPHGAAPEVRHAKLARRAAMTWPGEDHASRAIARYDDGDLYGALRPFGDGRVLGLASNDLLTNVGLAVPGNAAAMIAMMATLDRHEFSIARREQGINPPDNPFSGLLHVGLGPALIHVVLFIPLLFLAYGVRQSAPRLEPAPRRRAFAEHIQAVGGLYARRRAASYALAVYAKHVDDRLRSRMSRGTSPAQFLAARSGRDAGETSELYARALDAVPGEASRGDELRVLQELSRLYTKAIERS